MQVLLDFDRAIASGKRIGDTIDQVMVVVVAVVVMMKKNKKKPSAAAARCTNSTAPTDFCSRSKEAKCGFENGGRDGSSSERSERQRG